MWRISTQGCNGRVVRWRRQAGRLYKTVTFFCLSTGPAVTFFYLFQSLSTLELALGVTRDWISHPKSKLSKRKNTKNRGQALVHSILDAMPFFTQSAIFAWAAESLSKEWESDSVLAVWLPLSLRANRRSLLLDPLISFFVQTEAPFLGISGHTVLWVLFFYHRSLPQFLFKLFYNALPRTYSININKNHYCYSTESKSSAFLAEYLLQFDLWQYLLNMSGYSLNTWPFWH